jgi:ABC-2 type transport system permease protein
MRVIDLMLKDLLQIIRDRKSLIFLVLLPIAFTIFFGSIFNAPANADARLPIGWLNYDGSGALSTRLRSMLEASEAIRLVVVEDKDTEQLNKRVRDAELIAAIIVPPEFSAQTTTGKTMPLNVIAPSTPAGQLASTAVQAVMKRLLSAVQTARLSAATIETRLPFVDGAAYQSYLEEALARASAAWQNPPLTLVTKTTGDSNATATKTRNGFMQASPGMIVQFAIFSLLTSAMVLVLERKGKTLERLLTTPISRSQIIGGHLLAMFVVVFLQQVLLVALGQFLFHVDYLREPIGALLMMAALSIWAASLGLLIGALAKSPEQVIVLSLVAMFFFSALGGAWFPLEVAGETFKAIGHATPTAWAMDGFQNIVLRGLYLSSVLVPAGALLVYSLVFFGVAVWRFKFE